MNSLSWLIYLAGMVNSLSSMLFLFGFGSLLIVFVYYMAVESRDYPFQGLVEGRVQFKYRSVFIGVLMTVLASVIPSKETVYLIAGSQAGETVVTSESGQEVLNDVKEILRIQLNNMKGQ